MEVLISVIISIVIGLLLGFYLNDRFKKQEIDSKSNQITTLNEEIKLLNDVIHNKNTENTEIKITNKELETKLNEAEKSFIQQKELWSEAETKLKDSFTALASIALENNNKNFLTLAEQKFENLKQEANNTLENKKQGFENLLKPINEMVSTYKTEVEKLQKENISTFTKFEQQLSQTKEVNQSLLQETNKLTLLLSNSKQRGQWGEFTIRRILELAGLADRFDFLEQPQDESGKYPDFVVHLPNHRSIIIDSKFNADSYLKALEVSTEQEKTGHLKQHSLNIKATIKSLIKKDYSSNNPDAIDFIVMFVPNDSFLNAAIEFEPNLVDDALKDRIVFATPSTLYALLKAVALGWEEFNLSQNAQQIQSIGYELLSRVETFINHLSKVGKGLDTAVKGYNEAVGSFESRLVQQVNKFKELGISSGHEVKSIEPIDNVPRVISAVEKEV